jgi:type II restriction enzyme
VCIFSYTHLAVLARYAEVDSQERSIELLHEVFRTVDALNPSKDATGYWQAVNRRIIDFDTRLRQIWSEEKIASSESVLMAKEEALNYFASERERMMRLSKEEAIVEVIRTSKIENKIKAAKSVTDNSLLAVE